MSRWSEHREYRGWRSLLQGVAWRWRVRLRVAGGGLIAGAVLMVGVQVDRRTDWSGVKASRLRLEAALAREVRASRELASLPAARAQAVAVELPVEGNHALTEIGLRLTERMAAVGLQVRGWEPLAVREARTPKSHKFRVSAEGSFAAAQLFLETLAALPCLVVPVEWDMERAKGGVLLNATFEIFVELPPGDEPASGAQLRDVRGPDPFDSARTLAAMPTPTARLVGLLRDARDGLALFEMPDGILTVRTGQRIGAERIMKIGTEDVLLANGRRVRSEALRGRE